MNKHLNTEDRLIVKKASKKESPNYPDKIQKRSSLHKKALYLMRVKKNLLE